MTASDEPTNNLGARFQQCADLCPDPYDYRSDPLWSEVHEATKPNPWQGQPAAGDLIKRAMRQINREYGDALFVVNETEHKMRAAIIERDMHAHNARTLLALLRSVGGHE